MPNPTLADVPEADRVPDERPTTLAHVESAWAEFQDTPVVPKEEYVRMHVRVTYFALAFFHGNREWLARCELEQAARKFAGASAETPVIVRPGAIHPRLFVMGETLAVNDDVVLVGSNWKPEAGR